MFLTIWETLKTSICYQKRWVTIFSTHVCHCNRHRTVRLSEITARKLFVYQCFSLSCVSGNLLVIEDNSVVEDYSIEDYSVTNSSDFYF